MPGLNLTGAFPPLITPFRENGDLDEGKFVANVKRWNGTPLTGYLVLGSNSEAAFLSHEEKLRLVEVTVREAAPGRTILVGSGMESARETIRLTNDAAAAGAQGALVLTPFYYSDQMNHDALVKYYLTVADASKIPILLYNVPKFTGISLALQTVRRLSEHPNIVGMKDSSGSVPQLAMFKAQLDSRFIVLVGTAGAWLPALQLGIEGGILALANCCPNECVAVRELFLTGRGEEAQELYQRLLPVNQAVTATYGVSGLKYACDLRGFHGGSVRTPLLPLTDSQKAELRILMTQAGFLQPMGSE